MIITNDYIEAHMTERGAWTDDQIRALTSDEAISRGRRRRAIGTEISPENMDRFEAKRTAKQAKKWRKTQSKVEDAPQKELWVKNKHWSIMTYDELLSFRLEIMAEMVKRPEFNEK